MTLSITGEKYTFAISEEEIEARMIASPFLCSNIGNVNGIADALSFGVDEDSGEIILPLLPLSIIAELMTPEVLAEVEKRCDEDRAAGEWQNTTRDILGVLQRLTEAAETLADNEESTLANDELFGNQKRVTPSNMFLSVGWSDIRAAIQEARQILDA